MRHGAEASTPAAYQHIMHAVIDAIIDIFEALER